MEATAVAATFWILSIPRSTNRTEKARESRRQVMCNGDRNGRFADAARPDDRHKARSGQISRQLKNIFIAAEHSAQPGRKIRHGEIRRQLCHRRLVRLWFARLPRQSNSLSLGGSRYTVRRSFRPPALLRRLAIWKRRLPSSTMTPGHTRDNRSFLVSTSFGAEIKTIKISSARAPNSTATPCFVRSLSLANKVKGPKEIPPLFRSAIVAMAPSTRWFSTQCRSKPEVSMYFIAF